MNNPSNVHAFFQKLSTTVASSEKSPSLAMLHSSKPPRTGYIAGTLQDMITATLNPPRLSATEINDFGVGLPPLAHG